MELPQPIQDEIQELTRDLFREDEMGAVIRVHLRIENLLIQTIECLLPNPKHLPRLNYDARVKLALALGLKERFGPPFMALGKLRNAFAHKLDTSLTKRAVNDLYTTLGPEEKDHVQKTFKHIKNDNPETRHIDHFADLDAGDQFKIIAISLWAVVRSAVILHSRTPSRDT